MLEVKPCLWDFFSSNYHWRGVRDKALEGIEDELGDSAGEIKAKIMSLRAQIGKEIGKVAKKHEAKALMKCTNQTWYFESRCSFF